MLCAPDQPSEFDAKATIDWFRDMAAGKLPFVSRAGGGGEPRSEFVCGFLGCDMQPFNPVLSTLPRLLRVKRSEPESNDLLSRSEEHTYELQSLMPISYAVFCLK